MNAELILHRFQQIEASLQSGALIQVIRDSECLILRTGERATKHSHLLIRLGSALGVLTGLTLTFFSPWGWAVSAISLLVLFIVPQFITSQPLLKIDLTGQRLIILQNSGAQVASVSLTDVRSLRGVHETKGWDPYNVLYAQLPEGVEVPLVLLIGESEKLAIEACRILGSLLECPATYTGPFGDKRCCYTPGLVI